MSPARLRLLPNLEITGAISRSISSDDTHVRFVLLAERYERRSVVSTSNLPFSQWDTIFKDPITAMAAVDRLVHHSTILELNGESYRATAASKKKAAEKKGRESENT